MPEERLKPQSRREQTREEKRQILRDHKQEILDHIEETLDQLPDIFDKCPIDVERDKQFTERVFDFFLDHLRSSLEELEEFETLTERFVNLYEPFFPRGTSSGVPNRSSYLAIRYLLDLALTMAKENKWLDGSLQKPGDPSSRLLTTYKEQLLKVDLTQSEYDKPLNMSRALLAGWTNQASLQTYLKHIKSKNPRSDSETREHFGKLFLMVYFAEREDDMRLDFQHLREAEEYLLSYLMQPVQGELISRDELITQILTFKHRVLQLSSGQARNTGICTAAHVLKFLEEAGFSRPKIHDLLSNQVQNHQRVIAFSQLLQQITVPHNEVQLNKEMTSRRGLADLLDKFEREGMLTTAQTKLLRQELIMITKILGLDSFFEWASERTAINPPRTQTRH